MTPVVTQDTAEAIWRAHREIAVARKMLSDLKTKLSEKRYTGEEPTLRDAFGRQRSYTLGVPTGDNGHQLFDVSPELAVHIIQAHIVKKQAALVECCAAASLELKGAVPVESPEPALGGTD